jgi:hypothetical protein
MIHRRMTRAFAVFLAAVGLAAVAGAEGTGMTPDAATLCRKNFDSASKVVANSFHRVKDPLTLKRLSEDLQAVLVCDAVAARTPQPCKASTSSAASATGGPEAKTMPGDLLMRCEHAMRFSSFLRETYAAKQEQTAYPACEGYFSHVQAVNVGPGFGAACADVETAIRNKSQTLCTEKLNPFVTDAKGWPAMCGAISRVWLQSDPSGCAVFPEPARCRVEASLVRAYAASGTSQCPPTGVEAGVCWGSLSKVRGTACTGLWHKLQTDFCSEMVMEGMNGKDKRGPEAGAGGVEGESEGSGSSDGQ